MAVKARELRELDDAQLIEALRTARRELFGLRFQHTTGELASSAALQHAKRDIARTLTVARERGLDVDRELSRDG